MLLNSLFQRALARAFHTRRSVWLALCALLQFIVDETDSGVTSVVIKGKGVDDAAGSADADLNAVMA